MFATDLLMVVMVVLTLLWMTDLVLDVVWRPPAATARNLSEDDVDI